MAEGVKAYASDVRERRYPEPDHCYTMAPDEVERLGELLALHDLGAGGARRPGEAYDALG